MKLTICRYSGTNLDALKSLPNLEILVLLAAKRVKDVDQATSARQLLEKLHQMRHNLGAEVEDSVFYFSGKWRSDPTYQRAYQQFQVPGIRTRIIGQQQERDFALQQVGNILHACGIHNKYVVMLDSGGGSTQIASGLVWGDFN